MPDRLDELLSETHKDDGFDDDEMERTLPRMSTSDEVRRVLDKGFEPEDGLIGKFCNGQLDFHDRREKCLKLPSGIFISLKKQKARRSGLYCPIFGVKDSISGIFDSIRQAVLECAEGGFQCLDFTDVRANGESVVDTGGIASGPVSFVKVWDAGVENANAMVRGIAIISEDHPDIETWKAYEPKNLIIGWY